MASNRAKLSLRRAKKQSSQPRQNPEPLSSHVSSTSEPPPTVGVIAERGEVSSEGVNNAAVCDSATGDSEERDGGTERGDTDDFRPLRKNGRKRKIAQYEPASYMDTIGQDQMQLALALSASLQPPTTAHDSPPEAKKGRQRKERGNEASVIAMSSADSQRILTQRASAIVQECLGSRSSNSGPPPSLYPSKLAGRLTQAGSALRDTSTLWEMAGYGEREKGSKFVVSALDLPTTISKSLQHSPVAHSHISHSSQHSPVAQISPQHSPVAHSHILQCSLSPQPSPQLHSSRSPQPSLTSHSHTSHPHPSQPPSLPRPVQTLLSDLSSLVGSQLCSDVVITVSDGRGIPAHSAILACRCPTLAERLFHSLDKPVHLDFSQFDRATVILFLRYLYTGAIPNQNGKKQVTMLAMSLGMMELLEERGEHHPLPHGVRGESGGGVRGEGGGGVRGEGGGGVRGESGGGGVRGEGSGGVRGESGGGVRGEGGGVRGEGGGVRGEGGGGVRGDGGGGVRGARGGTDDDMSRKQAAAQAKNLLSSAHVSSAVYAALQRLAVGARGTTTPDTPTHQATPTVHNTTTTGDGNVHSSSLDVISVSSDSPSSPHPHPSTSPPQTPSPRSHRSPPTPSPSQPPVSHQQDMGSASSPSLSSQLDTQFSPRPLLERISSSSAVPLPPESHDKSHDESPNECTSQPQAPPTCSLSAVVTPAPTGQKPVLESDTDITPMPEYLNMATPHLKGECARFGVRALPKRKMIAKLEEIYNYTHPLTDADGNVVVATDTSPTRKKVSGGDGKKATGRRKEKTSSEKPNLEELMEKVREVITKETKLYEDVLLYKPVELSHIQSQLKAASLPLSRETLMDVLDSLCITFSVPRQSQEQ